MAYSTQSSRSQRSIVTKPHTITRCLSLICQTATKSKHRITGSKPVTHLALPQPPDSGRQHQVCLPNPRHQYHNQCHTRHLESPPGAQQTMHMRAGAHPYVLLQPGLWRHRPYQQRCFKKPPKNWTSHRRLAPLDVQTPSSEPCFPARTASRTHTQLTSTPYAAAWSPQT